MNVVFIDIALFSLFAFESLYHSTSGLKR